MSLEIPEYRIQISEYKELILNYQKRESIYREKEKLLVTQLGSYERDLSQKDQLIMKQERAVKRLKRLTIGGFSISAILVAVILVK